MIATSLNRELLIAAVSAVALAAHADPARGVLCGVHLRRKGAALIAEASNGHWLAHVKLDAAFSGEGADAATVALAGVKPLIAALKAARGANVSVDLGKHCVSDDAGTSAVLHVVDGVFPPVDTLLALCDTTHEHAPAEVGFSAMYLASVAKAFDILRKARGIKADSALRFRFGADALDPLLVTCSRAPELIAVIMPVRL